MEAQNDQKGNVIKPEEDKGNSTLEKYEKILNKPNRQNDIVKTKQEVKDRKRKVLARANNQGISVVSKPTISASRFLKLKKHKSNSEKNRFIDKF